MDISKHATARSQQRGIPEPLIDLILELGTPNYKPGGALEYSIPKKIRTKYRNLLKRRIKQLDKTANKCVLVNEGKITTVYNRTRKYRRP